MIDEALASLPAQMKNEPAQKLEMKDFSPAVGMMAADTLAGLRHYPLAACREAIPTSCRAEECAGSASDRLKRSLPYRCL